MKHADKNEVDLLLRGFAKRERDARSANGQEDHLGADELNAYAEDALPSATRARYTAHIADCASCRKIVTQLTLAAGAAVRAEVATPSPGTTFWQKLAALFSPAVLRYAAPALGVLAVITAGFIFLSLQSRSEYVARNEPAASAPATQQTETSSTEPGLVHYKSSEPKTPLQSNDRQGKADNRVAGKDRETGQSAGSSGSSVTTAKDAKSELQAEAGIVAKPSYAPEPSAAAAPPPKEVQRATKSEEVAKAREESAGEREKLAEADTPARKRVDAPVRAKDEGAANRVGVTQPAGRTNTGSGAVASRRVQSLEDKNRKQPTGNEQARDDDEVRSVAGRRFRRDGNTWIDINYDSSRALVNVKRGSEQYRALVADEPGLRTISETLKGSVIVVWKDRAYRIQ
jgi:Putative zinc-finger